VNLLWTILLAVISVGAGTLLCFRLIYEGSIRLVSNAIYLVLQIPVMLIYCAFLKQQLP